MPPKRKASSADRVARRRRVPENDPHPSQLTIQPATREPQQSLTAANPPPAQNEQSVNAAWLANLGNSIAAAVQKSLQESGISLTTSQAPSQPGIQFVSEAPQTNRVGHHPQDGSVGQTSVQAAVQQVTANLVEGAKEPPSSKNTFVSSAVPLSHRVSDKVKKQIWGNEYVDFAVIFSNGSTSDDQYTFKVLNGRGEKPILSLEQNVKKQPIHTTDHWTAAFQAFVAVYCERFPSETAQLMKYGATVRDLAERGANWKFYDENFRLLRQREVMPWAHIHSELWLRASVPKTKQPIPSKSTQKQSGQFFPKGFCWTFLRGGNCPGCDFKHQCFKCGLNHPVSRCQQNQKRVGQRPFAKPGWSNRNTSTLSATHTSQG